MNKKFNLTILMLTFRICSAQNLIPNGDFEQFLSCPSGISQIYLAAPWFQPSTGTSDYYNACATSQNVGVPYHGLGYQPARSGNGYAGFVLISNQPDYREYISIQFLSPLTAGTSYHVEFYINLRNNYRFTTDALGIYFSSAMVSSSNGNVLPFVPQINNTVGNLPDTLSWTLVSGTFIAAGGENYMTIGNFKNDANTAHIVFDSTALAFGAYVFIEDVSLTPITNIIESNDPTHIKIYPNPFSENLTLNIKDNNPAELILFDLLSQISLQQKIENTTSINTTQLARGIYLYEVKNKNGDIKKGKVVKE